MTPTGDQAKQCAIHSEFEKSNDKVIKGIQDNIVVLSETQREYTQRLTKVETKLESHARTIGDNESDVQTLQCKVIQLEGKDTVHDNEFTNLKETLKTFNENIQAADAKLDKLMYKYTMLVGGAGVVIYLIAQVGLPQFLKLLGVGG
jgi:chromosome segregation ATPase